MPGGWRNSARESRLIVEKTTESRRHEGRVEMFEQERGRIDGAATEVHRIPGSELLEPSYQHCLARELSVRDIPFQKELSLTLE